MNADKWAQSICRVAIVFAFSSPLNAQQPQDLRQQATAAMKKAATFYREQVASRNGYVYFYSLDMRQRWGEGEATVDQIWIQPPGTPTVGLALLKAYQATGDHYYLEAATSAGLAVAYGQLKSGGWTNCVDFDPRGKRSANYRNGKGRGKNNSSLDDGQTQSALRFMISLDKAHRFQHARVHESAEVALNALLQAQFPNGAFPQVWTGAVKRQAVLKASYPDYDWRSEGRIKNYWDMYTLNDNVCGYVADTLITAHQVYKDEKYLKSLKRLGDFLVLAQMPEPQPAWAQQYNYAMQPIWAHKFEPPGVSGDESQEAIETLLKIARVSGDRKYLEPIPRALTYLSRSLLSDGRLARFYELKSNKPLYMLRRGKVYLLTNSDANLPSHYGWKITSRLDALSNDYQLARTGKGISKKQIRENEVRRIISALDDRGRWISVYDGKPLVGQAKMAPGAQYLSSELFSRRLAYLSAFLVATSADAAKSPSPPSLPRPPAPTASNTDDPVLKLISELQQEVRQLRKDIRQLQQAIH